MGNMILFIYFREKFTDNANIINEFVRKREVQESSDKNGAGNARIVNNYSNVISAI